MSRARLREAMHQAIGEPRITLRAAPDVVAALESRVAEIAHEEGYDGRVMIAADPAIKGADCRIEWRGGGSERSEAAIEAALDALIARHFSEFVRTLRKDKPWPATTMWTCPISAMNARRGVPAALLNIDGAAGSRRPSVPPPTWKPCSTCR